MSAFSRFAALINHSEPRKRFNPRRGAKAQPADRAPPSGGKPDMRSMGGAVRAPESSHRGSQG